MFQLVIKPAAEKLMDRLPGKVRQRVVQALAELRDEPRPSGCAKLAGSEELWRIRVGQYRVVYTIRQSQLLVVVLRIGQRGGVYRGM